LSTPIRPKPPRARQHAAQEAAQGTRPSRAQRAAPPDMGDDIYFKYRRASHVPYRNMREQWDGKPFPVTVRKIAPKESQPCS
jgi:hypothetical protein